MTFFFNNNEIKFKIDADTIDYAINLGGFGKTSIDKRYSVYFCSCIFQVIYSINVKMNDQFNNSIINRIIMLTSEPDRMIRNEISYQLKYFIKGLDENYLKKNMFKIVIFFYNF